MSPNPPSLPAGNARDLQLSKNLQRIARLIGRELDAAAGGPVLFSLIVWNQKSGSRAQYVANAVRADVIKGMEELLERWKQGMPDVPAHEVQ